MIKKLAIIVGAYLWGLIVFRIAMGIHFPSEDLANKARAEFEKATGSNFQLSINSLSLAGLIGVEANQTTIYKKEANDESTPYLFIDSLAVVLNPFEAIGGTLGAHVSSDFMNGTIDGNISGDSFTPQRISTDWTISDIALELIPLESESFSATLGGKLSSELSLQTPFKKAHKEANGDLRINIKNLAIREAKAQGITLPELVFSEATILGSMKNGKITVDGTSFVSDSLGINLSGTVTLAKRLDRSRLQLTLDLTLGKEFELISKMVPELKQNKQSDGSYKLNIHGTLSNPKIRSNKGKNNKGKNDRKTDRVKSKDPSEAPDQDKLSPEEKRKERRERMERRKKARETRKNKSRSSKGKDPEEEEESEEEDEEDEADEDEDEEEDNGPLERITTPNMSKIRDISFDPRFERENEEEDENIETDDNGDEEEDEEE